MKRVSKPPEVRRRELLDAAAELFLNKGYEATAVRDVLAVVGGQPGMFYYYFPSKAALFREAMGRYVGVYVEEVTAILTDKRRAPAERLRCALELAAGMLARFNVATDQGAAAETTGLFTANCLYFLDLLVAPAAALLREFRPETEEGAARTTARFFLYGMFGLMHDGERGGDEAALLEAVREAYPLAAGLLDIPDEKLKGER